MHNKTHTLVTGCQVGLRRPGLVESFMQPTKLKKQNTPGQATSKIRFTPVGKNQAGIMVWKARIIRPGLVAPVIVAKRAPDIIKNEIN